jgi:hypothetical protein
MEDGDNRSEIAFDDEEDGEGKLAEQGPLNWIGLDRKLPGILRDAPKDRIQFGEETRDKGRIARVVPRQRVIDVELRTWLHDEAGHGQRGAENLRSSSARTSLQGRPAVGLAR